MKMSQFVNITLAIGVVALVGCGGEKKRRSC